MVITRTINSDKRYYLDENTIINQESFLDTLSRFNDMKIQLYNAMYEKKYMDNGPLISKTYSAWMKEKFHTNDYYNSSVYTSASAVLSSQDELKSFYVQSRKQDLETRDEKIESVRHYLENKLKIKQAVLSYIKKQKSGIHPTLDADTKSKMVSCICLAKRHAPWKSMNTALTGKLNIQRPGLHFLLKQGSALLQNWRP